MKKIKSICIITDSYPTDKVPRYTFVEQLVFAWAKMGIKCTVLNPVSLTNVLFRGGELKPKEWEKTIDVNTVKIYSPRYISFTTKKNKLFNFAKYTFKSYLQCCLKFMKDHHEEFDVVYGHFVYSGMVASQITKLYNIPSFFAYGENTTYTIDYLGDEVTRKMLKNISGVISVSTVNKNVLVEKNLVNPENIRVFPNAVDKSIFYPRDKQEMRKKYGFPQDAFIIAFVGYFVHIKGADRLSQAIEKVGSDKIKSIFIGQGEDVVPTCDGILFKGKQQHSKIGEMLSAADIFVLPTIAEGCCNAIIEALSCGLPVISSDKPFNDDILDETCSIRVDSMNVDDIAEAIKKLYYDPRLRKQLSIGASKKTESLEINKRARLIKEFMEFQITKERRMSV